MKSTLAFAALAFWLGLTPCALAQSVSTYAVGNTPTGIAFDRTNLHVSNLDDGTVSKINPKTGAVILTYPAGGHPDDILFDGTYIWTANNREGSVSKLTTAGVLKGTYPVGGAPIRLAFDGSSIWVSLPDAGRVAKISRSTGAVLGSYAAGPTPFGIISDGTHIWIVNGPVSSPGRLTKLSKTGSMLATFDTGGSTSREIATDGTFLYVTNYSSGTISKLRKSSGEIDASFIAEPGVHDVFYEAHQLWIENLESRTVVRINTTNGALLETVNFAEGVVPGQIGFDGVRIWSTNYNTASVSAF